MKAELKENPIEEAWDLHAKESLPISREIISFLVDRQARRLSPRTISFYGDELRWLEKWLGSQGVFNMVQIDTEMIRKYLIHLSESRNAGGQHASFRAIKAWMNWFELELDDDNWKNPMRKIQGPKVDKEVLAGVPLENLNALLRTCDYSYAGQRDRAILLTLLDSGLRRNELLALRICDLNIQTGAVQVINGKGGKNRTVYVGARTRKTIIRYLRDRKNYDDQDPLFVTLTGGRLGQDGLRQIIRRRAERAGVEEPRIHDFRRSFAIESLRNGMDLVTLMHLMGHTSTTVLQRYLKLLETDLQAAHRRASPVDRLK